MSNLGLMSNSNQVTWRRGSLVLSDPWEYEYREFGSKSLADPLVDRLDNLVPPRWR